MEINSHNDLFVFLKNNSDICSMSKELVHFRDVGELMKSGGCACNRRGYESTLQHVFDRIPSILDAEIKSKIRGKYSPEKVIFKGLYGVLEIN